MEENKYEVALERAKSAIKECGDNVGRIKMIESIFPELKESAGEKIRKALIDYFEGWQTRAIDENAAYYKDIAIKDILAWLEKQVSPDMVADAYLRGCNDTEKKWLESKRYTKMDVDNAYLEGIANAKREFEKQGKQEWTDEDEKMFEEYKLGIQALMKDAYVEKFCNWIFSLKQRLLQ